MHLALKWCCLDGRFKRSLLLVGNEPRNITIMRSKKVERNSTFWVPSDVARAQAEKLVPAAYVPAVPIFRPYDRVVACCLDRAPTMAWLQTLGGYMGPKGRLFMLIRAQDQARLVRMIREVAAPAPTASSLSALYFAQLSRWNDRPMTGQHFRLLDQAALVQVAGWTPPQSPERMPTPLGYRTEPAPSRPPPKTSPNHWWSPEFVREGCLQHGSCPG